MRLIAAVRADLAFQWKQGFFLVYVILTGMYLVVLSLLPDTWVPVAAPVVIFSDPAALGLFFIGGILMLEKTQGVLHAVFVSPLKTTEYLISKIFTLTCISMLAGAAIAGLGPGVRFNWYILLLSIFFASVFFTLCGIVICAGCRTVNQYFIKMIPYMILLVLPCLSILYDPCARWASVIPSVAALRLLFGAYESLPVMEVVILCLYLSGVNYFLFRQAVRVFERKMIYA